MKNGFHLKSRLGATPETIREELNEWIALDKPGHYTVYVTSGRVSRRGATNNQPVTLDSNSLEFDVVERMRSGTRNN